MQNLHTGPATEQIESQEQVIESPPVEKALSFEADERNVHTASYISPVNRHEPTFSGIQERKGYSQQVRQDDGTREQSKGL